MLCQTHELKDFLEILNDFTASPIWREMGEERQSMTPAQFDIRLMLIIPFPCELMLDHNFIGADQLPTS